MRRRRNFRKSSFKRRANSGKRKSKRYNSYRVARGGIRL